MWTAYDYQLIDKKQVKEKLTSQEEERLLTL